MATLIRDKLSFNNQQTRPARLPNDFDAFVLSEDLGGDQPTVDDPQTIELVGNQLPHVPFEWGGRLRYSETNYPGWDEPTVQVLGNQEEPITVTGRLHDRRQQADLGVAYATMEALEELRRRGNMLKITLGEWVRYGYLDQTRFRMKTKRDMEYELDIFIVSEFPPQQCPLVEASKRYPSEANARLKELKENLDDNLLDYTTDYPQDPFDVINDVVSDVSAEIAKVTDAVDAAIGLFESFSRNLNRAVALVASAKAKLFQYNQRIGKLQLDANVRQKSLKEAVNYSGVTNAYPQIKKENVTSGYKNVERALVTKRLIYDALVEMLQIATELDSIINRTPKARHVVSDGETLQTIAVQYYGDASFWYVIYKHNKLTPDALAAGDVLEIPNV